jgi:hypothetical protein
VVAASMVVVSAIVFGLRSVLGGVSGGWLLLLWFTALWLAVDLVHRRRVLDRSDTA